MKATYAYKSLGIFSLAVLLFLPSRVKATVAYWDPEGFRGSYATYTNGSLAGTWESTLWARNPGGVTGLPADQGTNAPVAWNDSANDAAVFAVGAGATNFGSSGTTTAFTMTMNSNHTVAGFIIGDLNPNSAIVTINGTGTISLSPGAQGFDMHNSSDSSQGRLILNVPIAGSGQLVPENNGQLFLNTSNTYTGGTQLGFPGTPVFSGILNFSNSAAFGSGNIVVSNISSPGIVAEGSSNSTYNITNAWVWSQSGNLNLVGTAAGVTYSGPWNLNTFIATLGSGGGTNNVDIISGVISGTGGISRQLQSSAGIIKLTGANTYTGPTSLQCGTTYAISLNSVTSPAQQASSSFGKPAGTGNSTINMGSGTNSASLVYTGVGETTDRMISLAGTTGGATIENDGSGPIVFTATIAPSITGAKTFTLSGNNAGTNTLAGGLFNSGPSDQVSLVKTQPGNWVLNAVNGYTGSTTINGGTLTIGPSGALSFGNYAGAITNNSSLLFNCGTPQFLAGPISGTGSLTENVPGGSFLELTGTNTYGGSIIIATSNTLYVAANGAVSAATLVMNPGSVLDFSGVSASGDVFLVNSTSNLLSLNVSSDPVIGGAFIGSPPSPKQIEFGSALINVTYDGGFDVPLSVSGSAPCAFANVGFNVTNTTGTPLGAGIYALFGSGGGIVYGTVSPYVTVSGAGLQPGLGGRVQIDNALGVDLVVSTQPAFTNLTASQSIVYGTPSITLNGTVVAPGPIYPTNGEQFDVNIFGIDHTATINDNTGDFSVNIVTTNIVASVVPWTIFYNYPGDSQLSTVVNSNTTLTVTKAPLTITANAQSKIYGQTVTTGTGNTNFTSSGLVNNQKVGTVTLTISGSGGTTNAGVSGSPYTITPSAATGGTFSQGNYSITYVTNLLTVNPAPVTLTASNAARFYSATNPVFAVAYNGLTNSQTLATSDIGGSPSLTTAATTNSPIGTYVITNRIGTLTSTNYTFASFTNGTLTVSPLPVILTGTRPFDGTNDASATILTISNNIDGTNLTLSGSALLAGSTAGVQAITNFSGLTLGGTAATNYTLTNATGSVTISNPHLPFSIVSVALDNTRTNVVIIYQTVSGQVYQLLSSPVVSAPLNTWTNEGASVMATGALTTNVVPVSGATKSYIVKHN